MKWATASYLLVAVLAASLIGCDGGTDGLAGGSGGGFLSSFGRGSDSPGLEGQWTVALFWDNGRNHHRLLREVKRDTQENTGWDDLMVVHEDDRSILYWGRYGTVEQAKRYVEKAKAVKTPGGAQAFPDAMPLPLPGQNPGPEEWQLENASGAYSVCVASFHNVPEKGFQQRKQAALTYCEQLREKGEEAYVHHGPSSSAVCVGTFPASAVRMVKQGGEKHPQIVDPRISKIMRKYPKLAVNGMEHRVLEPVRDEATGNITRKKVLAKSYPVKIPSKQEGQGGNAFGGFGHTQPR